MATKLKCIIIIVMFKIWASRAKLWSVNLNSSLKLVNIWLVVIVMYSRVIGKLTYDLPIEGSLIHLYMCHNVRSFHVGIQVGCGEREHNTWQILRGTSLSWVGIESPLQ